MAGFEIRFEALDAASPTIQKLSQELLEAAQRSDRFAKDVVVSTQKVDQALSNLPPRAQQASQSMGALQAAGQQLANQLLQFATVAGIAQFFKSSAEAALEEEAALKRLEFAVNTAGGSFGKSKEQLLAFAAEQEAMTQFSDTQTFEALGRLVRVTGDVNSAMTATRLVFGLASASGRDFNSVIEMLGPILNGDSTRLRALKTEFGDFVGDAQSAQQVVDALSKRFLGAAEAQDSYGKRLQQLKNQLNNFQESVGAGIIPVFEVFLKGLSRGAEFMEQLGTVLANFAAEAFVSFQGLGQVVQALFRRDFAGIVDIVKETGAKIDAIEEGSAEQAAEIHRRYHAERQGMIARTAEIHVRKTREVVQEERKAGDELLRLVAERTEAEGKASTDRATQERKGLESRLILIDVEKQTRLRALDELKSKGLITETELTQAKSDAVAIAIAKSQEARNAIDENLLVIKGTEEAVASSLSSSFGRAVADIILEGKSLEDAMKAVFDTILRTAIETFVQIAIQRAIISAGVGAATGGAGAGAGGGFLSGIFGAIGLA
ncbi:MAG TPA: hypothetical protein DCM05_17765, partial [Elusimicrobia bacterium]|nr:hypothetical protein [Elusimicrobiota bacterium]